MLLLRWLKRRAAFREQDFEDTLLAVFYTKDGKPDTSLSVYEIDDVDTEVVQTHAEHAVGCLSGPPKHFISVDVTGFVGPDKAKTRGATGFEFTSEAHRELRFQNEEVLRAFVRALCDANPRRTMESMPREIRGYAMAKQASNDPEWIQACSQKHSWDKWIRKKDEHAVAPPASTTPSPNSTIPGNVIRPTDNDETSPS